MTKDDFHKEKTIPPLSQDRIINDPVEIPKNIGPYKIESLFEKGSMSVLYLGIHQDTLEPAIIKVLPEKYVLNKEVVSRFLKEADIIAMTDHPNIVKLFDHGEWEGGLYIAIEFIQGISLRQYILQKHISLKRAVEMIIEIAYALCHLHMHGVIHRDLKPENIIIPDTGPLKVIDFGIAQLLTEKNSNHPLNGPTFIGTPIYMSPEQKKEPESVSYPSDIYSLAIISYELILGKLSYGQIHLSLMPKGIRKILSKALQTDPKLRYQDVVDFISDVSSYLHSSAIKEEQNISDQISELSENLRKTQMILLPDNAPDWKEFDIHIKTHKEHSPFGLQQGIYQDFFEISDNAYGVIMTDSTLKHQESFVYTAATRGMIRALCRLTTKPNELITILNDLIVNDPLRHELSLNYLVLEPEKNILEYLSCGDGNLYFLEHNKDLVEKISNHNPKVGLLPLTDFTSVNHQFKKDDLCLLTSLSGAILKENKNKTLLDDEIMKCLVENRFENAEKITQNILKRLKLIFSKSIFDSVVAMICIKRQS